jgi:hypothetical protein
MRSEVTFEDGRKGMLDGDVQVIDMKIHPPSGAAAWELAR